MQSAVTFERAACFTASSTAPRPQRVPCSARASRCQPCSATSNTSAADAAADDALTRRAVMSASLASAVLTAFPNAPAHAVQGYTAGRIPGLTKSPDADGFFTYTRPEGKQGGHGVGWSELPRYAFKVPPGWSETAVSIADLGGTEIDLRFTNPEEGGLEVVVAPVMRFKDIAFNANVKIEDIAPPDRIISGFALEIFGSPLQEGDVVQQEVDSKDGRTFYSWELKPHRLVTATAVKNRLILLSVTANPRQWRKSQGKLQHIWRSLNIVDAEVAKA